MFVVILDSEQPFESKQGETQSDSNILATFFEFLSANSFDLNHFHYQFQLRAGLSGCFVLTSDLVVVSCSSCKWLTLAKFITALSKAPLFRAA